MTTRHRQTPATAQVEMNETPPLRSEGPMNIEQVQMWRAAGQALAYDPLQIGWVRADTFDDIDMKYKPSAGPRYAKLTAPKGQNYALRHWRDSDLSLFHAMLNDPAVWTYMPEAYPAPLTKDMARALIEVSHSSNHHEVYAVISRGTPIGQVRLAFPDTDDIDAGELSYWLGRQHWGQGHGRAMVTAFVDRTMRDHPGLAALTARVHRDNTASDRIIRSTGFTPTHSDGVWNWYRRAR